MSDEAIETEEAIIWDKAVVDENLGSGVVVFTGYHT